MLHVHRFSDSLIFCNGLFLRGGEFLQKKSTTRWGYCKAAKIFGCRGKESLIIRVSCLLMELAGASCPLRWSLMTWTSQIISLGSLNSVTCRCPWLLSCSVEKDVMMMCSSTLKFKCTLGQTLWPYSLLLPNLERLWARVGKEKAP